MNGKGTGRLGEKREKVVKKRDMRKRDMYGEEMGRREDAERLDKKEKMMGDKYVTVKIDSKADC